MNLVQSLKSIAQTCIELNPQGRDLEKDRIGMSVTQEHPHREEYWSKEMDSLTTEEGSLERQYSGKRGDVISLAIT